MNRFRTATLWWLTFGLLVASVAVNVVQARKLRTTVSEPYRTRTKVGQVAAPFSVLDQDGRPTVIRFDRGLPTVLYYFSTQCPWCARNWDNVRALASSADGRYRVVALTAETKLDGFLAEQHFDFEVYGGMTESARKTLGFSGTPHTVVVSPQGRVSHDWEGAFKDSIGRGVEELFEFRLPGLLPSARGHLATAR